MPTEEFFESDPWGMYSGDCHVDPVDLAVEVKLSDMEEQVIVLLNEGRTEDAKLVEKERRYIATYTDNWGNFLLVSDVLNRWQASRRK
jgi:hypothetical protein